ncbi:MAG: hypothetical protein IJN62_05170 [Clostridia bacterium]|nr:hypothetical protein [Clostridia bacterium]
MKSYVKPALEVISMKTSENIADNLIKTIYTQMTTGAGYSYTSTDVAYDESADMGATLS